MEESGRTAVAVLNIKNLPDALYKKLQARAKKQHRSIAQEVTHLLTGALETPKPLSILDLKGLGKDHWHKVDPSKHIQEERSSWD
jgi:plasmid stability protein